jgi:hypothetical protein
VKAWAVLLAVVASALLVAALALRPPAPLPADAPAQRFSAARAWTDVVAIAQRPHPTRSPDQARVRDALFVRMADLGLAPRLRPVQSPAGGLYNLLGALPGADRTTPAVLLMAHYDSVPSGPGAADDGAGVAAILEVARALKASGPRKREVMVLLTDGEEAGLYGARSFFSSDPERDHVGVVINLEARGDRGRAVMFETQRQSGGLIAFLTSQGALSGASSLMPDLYRRLPNGTDLTEALNRGYAGVNFAFFGGLDAYHRPTDTPARLDPASLQHIGDQALAAAKALANAAALPAPAPDQVYADLLGGRILHYPPAAGWVMLALALAGLAIATVHALVEAETSVGGLAAGAFGLIGLAVGLAVLLSLDGLARRALSGGHPIALLRHGGEVLTGDAMLSGGFALIWLRFGQGRVKPASVELGALWALAILVALLQATAPLDAFILAWPLLLCAVLAVLRARFGDRRWVDIPIAIAGAAQIFYWSGLLFDLQGQALPAVLTPFMVLAAMMLSSLAPSGARRAGWVGLICAMAGVTLTLRGIHS